MSTNPEPTTDGPERLETDASAGWREEYDRAAVPTSIEPGECGAPNCERDGGLVTVIGGEHPTARVLCPEHARDHMEVSS